MLQDAIELIEREGLVVYGGLELGRATGKRIAANTGIGADTIKKAFEQVHLVVVGGGGKANLIEMPKPFLRHSGGNLRQVSYLRESLFDQLSKFPERGALVFLP